MKLLVAAFTALVIPFAIAAAEGPAGPPPKPPQEAIDACAKAKRGESCSFAHRDHQLSGTCESPPDGSALACRPDQPPPPPEAVSACASAKQGDTCSFTLGDRSLSGTCERGPDAAKPLACRPPRR